MRADVSVPFVFENIDQVLLDATVMRADGKAIQE